MVLLPLVHALVALLIVGVVAVALLRVLGLRVEVRFKPVRRRRRTTEPDEHTQFL